MERRGGLVRRALDDGRSRRRSSVVGVIALVTTALVAALVALWFAGALATHAPGTPALVWIAVSTLALVASGMSGRLERLSGVLLLGAALVPVGAARTVRGAFLLIGMPWLAFFVARTLPPVGHVTAYSGDDWLAYQVAGYRIYMHGFWLEGGTQTFDYQPLYRWISGAPASRVRRFERRRNLLDASCLWCGALSRSRSFEAAAVSRSAAGARGTLATFARHDLVFRRPRTVGDRRRRLRVPRRVFICCERDWPPGDPRSAAGVCAVLMFYARLNHLLFAVVPGGAAVPGGPCPRRSRGARRAPPRCRARLAAVYARRSPPASRCSRLRTWWYTGVFSLLYGTEPQEQRHRPRLTTIAIAGRGRTIAHSLSALVWMNEPPRPDPRALLSAAGVLAAIGRGVPGAAASSAAGLARRRHARRLRCSSFLAHTHNYPGRMSIHLVPFAAALVVLAAAKRSAVPA